MVYGEYSTRPPNGFVGKIPSSQKPDRSIGHYAKNGMKSMNGVMGRALSTGRPEEESEEAHHVENGMGESAKEEHVKGRLKNFRISKTTRHKLKG